MKTVVGSPAECSRKITSVTIAMIITWALVAAVAATPQQAENDVDGSQAATIGGQSCDCIPFYLCDADKVVNPLAGSTDTGCSSDLVCCRSQNAPPDTDLSTTQTISSTTTREPFIDQQQQQEQKQQDCKCVPKYQCLTDDDNEHSNFDVRVGNCNKDYVCCKNTGGIGLGLSNGIKNNYNDMGSCGLGMQSPSNNYPENVGSRIVGSEEKSNSYFGQFPWMVGILKKDIDQTTGERDENVFQCGGSLIHPRVVLTAGHCVKNTNLKSMKVRVGEWDVQSSNSENESSKHQDLGVSQVVIHPNHNNKSMFNDVALIELESTVELSPYVNTICIPNVYHEPLNYDSQSCISTGWGKNGFEQNSHYQTILKKVELSLVPNDVCQQQLRSTRLGNFFRLHGSFICAGGKRGEDVCRGDGGGPLICELKSKNGKNSHIKKYVQVGIVSWGIGCGDENIPGVYASLISNSKWITDQLDLLLHN